MAVEVASATAEKTVLRPAELRSGKEGTWVLETDGGPRSLAAVENVLGYLDDRGVDAALLSTSVGVSLREASGGQVDVFAFTGDLREIRPFPLLDGSWPGPEPRALPGLVLNEAAAQLGELRLRPTPGSPPMSTRTVAIIDDGEAHPQAWLAWVQLREWAGMDETTTVQIVARHPGNPYAAGDALADAVSVHQLPTSVPPRSVDVIGQLEKVLASVRGIFLVLGAITLFVGVIGVLNVGLATLRERAEEVALRRSLGASRGEVAYLILGESVLIGILGACAAATVAAALYYTVLPRYLDLSDAGAFPLHACVLGVAVGSTAGLLGGAVPAWRASRLPIAATLRG
jgi:putative ABC transport system permease protein